MDSHAVEGLLRDFINLRHSDPKLKKWSTVLARLNSVTDKREFNLVLMNLRDNFDRVRFVFAAPSVRSTLDSFIEEWTSGPLERMCTKSATRAEKFRNVGNTAFSDGRYQDSVVLYSKALLYAPEDCAEASLAYGNRSAAYFKLDEHENALLDIDMALSLRYAQYKPVIKLQLRKVDSLLHLERTDEAKQLLNEINKPENSGEADFKRWEMLSKSAQKNPYKKPMSDEYGSPFDPKMAIEKIKNKGRFTPSTKMSTVSSKVELRYHPTKGRHLVALEDLDFGEVIMFAQPYAVILRESHELRLCHHCCRSLKPFHQPAAPYPSSSPFNRPIPCGHCVSVLYCSEQCRTDSWVQYHRFECGFLPLLYPTKGSRLALRMLFRAGVDSIQAVIKQVKDKPDHFDDPLSLCDPEDYSHVYRLTHHSDKMQDDEDFLERIFTACLLALVAKKCGFYKETNRDQEVFVAGIILRHTFQVYMNSGNISDQAPATYDPKTDDFSTPIYLNCSLLNHACDQNAFLTGDAVRYGHSFNLIQAMRPIKAGEGVLINYGIDFIHEDKLEQRKRYLWNCYFFNCACERCLLEERDTPDGLNRYYAIVCPDCAKLMTAPGSGMGFYLCENGHRLSTREMVQKYREVEALLEQIDRLIASIGNGGDGGDLGAQVDLFEIQLRDSLAKLLCRSASHRLVGLFDKLTEFRNTQGKFKSAFKAAEESLEMYSKVFGPQHGITHGQLSKMMKMFVEPIATGAVIDANKLRKRAQKVVNRFKESRVKMFPGADKWINEELMQL